MLGAGKRMGKRSVMRLGMRGLAGALALVLACACSVAAQSRNAEDLRAGKLLVASRETADPIFARSVILLVQYDKNGALGLMLNHRTTLPISRALKNLKDAAKNSDSIFIGGPVELDAVFALAQATSKPDDAMKVAGDVYFIETKAGLEKALGESYSPNRIHVYVGYCGWAPGQLDDEVLNGGWYIFDGKQDSAFDRTPATLWQRLIAVTEHPTVMLDYRGVVWFGAPTR
jgi:putative transcriptional regulator